MRFCGRINLEGKFPCFGYVRIQRIVSPYIAYNMLYLGPYTHIWQGDRYHFFLTQSRLIKCSLVGMVSNGPEIQGSKWESFWSSKRLYSIFQCPFFKMITVLRDNSVLDFCFHFLKSNFKTCQYVLQVKNGHIKRVTDDEIQSLIIEIIGANVR